MKVQLKIGLQLFHVEFEVADLAQIVHLLDKKHRVVFVCCHEQIIVS